MNNPGKRLFLVALLALSMAGARAQPVGLEYQVKASYLYNFVRFVTWPAGAFGGSGKFNLCIVGAERFGDALNALVGERVESHEIVIRRLGDGTQARAARCHALFFTAGTETADFSVDSGVLTVGEAPGFLERGGIINLVEVQGRIRFEINQPAARKAGLVVSSRLLSLSTNKP